MKILFISQIVPYPPHGGVLQRGYNILCQIAKKHDVHLLSFVHHDELSTASMVAESKRELEKVCCEVEYFDLWPKKSALNHYLALGASLVYTAPFSVLAHRSSTLKKRLSEINGEHTLEEQAGVSDSFKTPLEKALEEMTAL